MPAADRDARRVRAARVPLRRGHPAPDVSDTLLRGSVLLLERLPAKAAPVELVVSIAAAAGYKKLSWRPKVVSARLVTWQMRKRLLGHPAGVAAVSDTASHCQRRDS